MSFWSSPWILPYSKIWRFLLFSLEYGFLEALNAICLRTHKLEMHTGLWGPSMEEVSSESWRISEEVEREVCLVSLVASDLWWLSTSECGCHTDTDKSFLCPHMLDSKSEDWEVSFGVCLSQTALREHPGCWCGKDRMSWKLISELSKSF